MDYKKCNFYRIFTILVTTLFYLSRNQHNFNTRNAYNLSVRFCRLEKIKQQVFYMGSLEYNRLPEDIKNIERISIFKRRIKEYITWKCFYYNITSFTFLSREHVLNIRQREKKFFSHTLSIGLQNVPMDSEAITVFCNF